MSYIFTRNKRQVVSFAGIFDPTIDQTQMENNWANCFDNTKNQWTVVSAPGGAGGYAHKIDALIDTADPGPETFLDLTPYIGEVTNKSGSYANYNWYKWKFKIETRMYIHEDLDQSVSGKRLTNCASICLDGAQDYQFWTMDLMRIWVRFNVDAQLMGIASISSTSITEYDIYTTAWSGSYDTWYDIVVYWEYNYWDDPDGIKVTVMEGQTQLFQYTVNLNQWRFRASLGGTGADMSFMNANYGRCGLGAHSRDYAAASTERVTVYFKDILITMDEPQLVEYIYKNSIVKKNAEIFLNGFVRTSNKKALGKGVDIQLFLRKNTSEDFSGQFRGITRSSVDHQNKMLKIEAEGVFTEFYGEKIEDLSLSAKTTGEIVKEAINNPLKSYINTTAYFDTTTATFDRDYMQQAKVDMLLEAGFLEGFFSFLDVGNNFRFQSPRSNYTNIDLNFAGGRIISYQREEVLIRKPNIVRVIGSGVYAERIIVEEMASTTNALIRNIHRLDLTVKTDCEDACNYYSSLYRKAIQVLKVEMAADYRIEPLKIITVTIPRAKIDHTKFLVVDVQCNSRRIMTLNLMEVSPQLSLFLSDIALRTDQEESQTVAADTVTEDLQFNVEGLAVLNIYVKYEIEISSVVVRSGSLTITDDFIDELLKVMDNQTINDPTHIAIGTGTTTAKYDDSALESESARFIGVATKQHIIVDYSTLHANYQTLYNEIKFTRTTVSGYSNQTEIGLFNASSGGTMSGRAIFDILASLPIGTIIRIIIGFQPEPHSTYVTWYGINQLITWLDVGTALAFTKISHGVRPVPIKPNPWLSSVHWFVPFTNTLVLVPKNAATFTFTKSINYPQDEIVFQMDYPDYDMPNDNEGSSDMDDPSMYLALSIASDNESREHFMMLYLLSADITGTSKNGANCLWRIILQIQRGEITE